MSNISNQTLKSQAIITLREVSAVLNYKNIDCTKKWLKKNGIKIQRIAKENVVYQIELDAVLEKPYVINLRNKHPQKWKEMYRVICKDQSLYELMIMELGDSTAFFPTTKVSLRSKSDDKLYKSLLL